VLQLQSVPVVPDAAHGAPPSRGLHTLTAVGSTLYLFGGTASPLHGLMYKQPCSEDLKQCRGAQSGAWKWALAVSKFRAGSCWIAICQQVVSMMKVTSCGRRRNAAGGTIRAAPHKVGMGAVTAQAPRSPARCWMTFGRWTRRSRSCSGSGSRPAAARRRPAAPTPQLPSAQTSSSTAAPCTSEWLI